MKTPGQSLEMSLSFEMKTGLERTKTFHAALQTHTGRYRAREGPFPTSHFHNGASALELGSEEVWFIPCPTHGSWICSWGPLEEERLSWMH